jgi:hypothetical protein
MWNRDSALRWLREVLCLVSLALLWAAIYRAPGLTRSIACRWPAAAPFVPYVIGYAFSLWGPVAPFWRIGAISALIWDSLGGTPRGHETRLPNMVGVVERSLYTTSYLLRKAEFIGAWLVLKVAGAWRGWNKGYAGVEGRAMYQTTLIGTGLSLAYGVMGALLVRWLSDGLAGAATTAATSLLALHLGIWWWAKAAFPPPGLR